MESTVSSRSEIVRWARSDIYRLSRVISILLVAVSLGSLFWVPEGWLQLSLDILFRTHLMFICTVMAHEASHGLLGKSKRANWWWGRFVLVPVTVPYVNFRKTHRMHHSNTNDPENDPDYFAKPNHWWEMPFRAVVVPHHWVYWLAKRNQLKRADVIELIWTYVGLACVYGSLLFLVGGERLASGIIPSLVLVSILLWYPFAVKTHEGFSRGAEETQSHNYYGKFMFWFTLGLSVHREHHMHQQLSWIELKQFVQPYPGPYWKRIFFPRHIIPETSNSPS
jgi:fatty acid desaturase